MTFKRSFNPTEPPPFERRSGLNRRWIKSPYDGPDRRKGQDRRNDAAEEPAAAEAGSRELSLTANDLERMLIANAIRLEAVVRLLEQKGLFEAAELDAAVHALQSELDERPLGPF